MAMNDISFLATTEQDTLLASRNSSLDRGSEGSGAEFLSQLHNAHNSIEPEKKGNTKADADAENYIAVPKQLHQLRCHGSSFLIAPTYQHLSPQTNPCAALVLL